MSERPEQAMEWFESLLAGDGKQNHLVSQLLDYMEAGEADSKRLDKLERLMRRGHDLSAYGFDEENDTWGKSGFAFSTEIDEDGFDVTVGRKYYPNIREAIDKLEEQQDENN